MSLRDSKGRRCTLRAREKSRSSCMTEVTSCWACSGLLSVSARNCQLRVDQAGQAWSASTCKRPESHLAFLVTLTSSVPAPLRAPPLSKTWCQYPRAFHHNIFDDTFWEPDGSHSLGKRSLVCLTKSIGVLDLLRLKKNDAIGQH